MIQRPMRVRSNIPAGILATTFTLLCAVAGPAMAQTSTDPQEVIDKVRRVEQDPIQYRLSRGPLDYVLRPWERLQNRLDKRFGFRMFALYAPVVQAASDAETANHAFDLFARWDNIIDSETWGKGSLDLFAFHRADDLMDTTTAEFQRTLGLAIPVNDNNINGSLSSVAQLAWEHLLFNDRLEIAFGQFDPNSIWDKNAYAGYDRESFLHKALSANPVRPFPGSGLGAGVAVNTAGGWRLSVGAMDAEANGEYPDFDSLSVGNWSYIAEARLELDDPTFGRGNYRFGFQQTEATDTRLEDTAWSLSFDQELADGVGGFFRYANGDGNRTGIKYFFSTGAVFQQPFASTDDWIGAGFFWSRPRENRREYGGELYWRIQLTRRTILTPDAMLIRPSNAGKHDVEFLANLRLTIAI